MKNYYTYYEDKKKKSDKKYDYYNQTDQEKVIDILLLEDEMKKILEMIIGYNIDNKKLRENIKKTRFPINKNSSKLLVSGLITLLVGGISIVISSSLVTTILANLIIFAVSSSIIFGLALASDRTNKVYKEKIKDNKKEINRLERLLDDKKYELYLVKNGTKKKNKTYYNYNNDLLKKENYLFKLRDFNTNSLLSSLNCESESYSGLIHKSKVKRKYKC